MFEVRCRPPSHRRASCRRPDGLASPPLSETDAAAATIGYARQFTATDAECRLIAMPRDRAPAPTPVPIFLDKTQCGGCQADAGDPS